MTEGTRHVENRLDDNETAQLRERLERAGLLAHPKPVPYPHPDSAAVAAAGKRAARGRTLSSIVIEERGPR